MPLPGQDDFASTPLGQRRLLSRAELAHRQGASPQDIKVVTDFAEAAGLKIVHTDAARRLVQVSGTVAQLSKAFSVELALYQSPKEGYRGREGRNPPSERRCRCRGRRVWPGQSTHGHGAWAAPARLRR